MADANSTVLVVDDDPTLRESVGRLLRSLGLEAQLFASIASVMRGSTAIVRGRPLTVMLTEMSSEPYFAVFSSALGALSSALDEGLLDSLIFRSVN
jgi:CheY-like chemotaxis protein